MSVETVSGFRFQISFAVWNIGVLGSHHSWERFSGV
jgi:hypothetical protein